MAGWSADKETARYSQQLDLGRQSADSKIVERHDGLRSCEESNGASGMKFNRYYKIQQDDQASVCEISVVFTEGLSLAQKILVAPFTSTLYDIFRGHETERVDVLVDAPEVRSGFDLPEDMGRLGRNAGRSAPVRIRRNAPRRLRRGQTTSVPSRATH